MSRPAPGVRLQEAARVATRRGHHLADKNGVKLERDACTRNSIRYYAVAIGRKPGIYNDWEEAKQQMEGYPDSKYQDFADRTFAMDYLRMSGIPVNNIRLFQKTFRLQNNFVPDPLASFKEEFNRLASSQNWDELYLRKARVDAIRDEIIKHCLPDGIRISIEQDDDEGYVDLDEDQCLEVYQAMCRKAGKTVRPTIDTCLLELKDAPFVNIIDFVDSFRNGEELHTFADWENFVDYTLDGHTIDMKMAKDNDFLAPLLQDLILGPFAVDPRVVRRRQLASRTALLLERKRNRKWEQESAAPKSEHPRELSPSIFDGAGPPRPPTPITIFSSPRPIHPSNSVTDPSIKVEPCSSSKPAAVSSTPPTEYPDSDYDSDPELIEEMIKLEASQPEHAPDLEYDSDPEFIEEMIKLEASQSALMSTQTMDFVQVHQLNPGPGDYENEKKNADNKPSLPPFDRAKQVSQPVSLGKRPRRSSRRTVRPAKKTCGEVHE
ncbi:hypothetical protein BDU57DRAFT_520251 [Ampelomyces quisqualis]|uniref:Ribonuclease H1 N-terminal domain-containing protein n=1 Tax=Ampelomyces quisqualis TaxID=50730 RepID=A0A6A5QHW8_AMPQU|nr:hypothetical protein BDU57DRAFT_520251 [Ampelomyces quisqualis]